MRRYLVKYLKNECSRIRQREEGVSAVDNGKGQTHSMNKSRDSYKCGNGHGSLGGTEAVYKADRKSGRRNR